MTLVTYSKIIRDLFKSEIIDLPFLLFFMHLSHLHLTQLHFGRFQYFINFYHAFVMFEKNEFSIGIIDEGNVMLIMK